MYKDKSITWERHTNTFILQMWDFTVKARIDIERIQLGQQHDNNVLLDDIIHLLVLQKGI